MRSRRFVALVFGLAIALAVGVMSAVPGHCKTVELTYSIFFPATTAHTSRHRVGKGNRKRTNGAVKIKHVPGGNIDARGPMLRRRG